LASSSRNATAQTTRVSEVKVTHSATKINTNRIASLQRSCPLPPVGVEVPLNGLGMLSSLAAVAKIDRRCSIGDVEVDEKDKGVIPVNFEKWLTDHCRRSSQRWLGHVCKPIVSIYHLTRMDSGCWGNSKTRLSPSLTPRPHGPSSEDTPSILLAGVWAGVDT
jgi:hypothetical protein